VVSKGEASPSHSEQEGKKVVQKKEKIQEVDQEEPGVEGEQRSKKVRGKKARKMEKEGGKRKGGKKEIAPCVPQGVEKKLMATPRKKKKG